MDSEESCIGLGCRIRKESNGGSSDSDISDGWNIVDHLEVNSAGVSSSDGESVEVIKGEDDVSQQDEDTDTELEMDESKTEAIQSVNESDCDAVVMSGERLLPREDMFDSSFCWFLITVTFAALIYNAAFMAVNSDFISDSQETEDSFISESCSPVLQRKKSDIPNKPDALPENSFLKRFESVEKEAFTKYHEDELTLPSVIKNKFYDKRLVFTQNHKNYNHNLKIDNQDIDNYFRVLTDITSSVEARKKFSKAVAILQSLNMEIIDAQEFTSENSDLNQVLNEQRNRFNDVLDEIKFEISESLVKLARKVLIKIKNMERKFEREWCTLERHGFKKELKELFYVCDEALYDYKPRNITIKKVEEFYGEIDLSIENNEKIQTTMDKYESPDDISNIEVVVYGENNEINKSHKTEEVNNNGFIKIFKNNPKKIKNNKQRNNEPYFLSRLPQNNKNEKPNLKTGNKKIKFESGHFVKHKKKHIFLNKSKEEAFGSHLITEICTKNKGELKKVLKAKHYNILKEICKKLKTLKNSIKKYTLNYLNKSDGDNKNSPK